MKRKSTRIGVLATSVALIAMLGAPNVSQAATAQVIAGPFAQAYGKYLTASVVVFQGSNAVFRNLDIVPHDVVSNSGLFATAHTIGVGQSISIWGVNTLTPGKYGFYCSIHPNMKGTLIVRKKL